MESLVSLLKKLLFFFEDPFLWKEEEDIAIVTLFGATDPSFGYSDYAAKVCLDLIFGGYDNWFLPSKGELHLIYTNLHLAFLGGFAADFYWSSTETGSSLAYFQGFVSGYQDFDSKGDRNRVRAVRAF